MKIFMPFSVYELIFVQFLLTNTEFDRYINAADEEAKDEVLKLKAQHLPVLNRTRSGSTFMIKPPFATQISVHLLQ